MNINEDGYIDDDNDDLIENRYYKEEYHTLTLVYEYYDSEDNFLLEKGRLFVGITSKETISEFIDQIICKKYFDVEKEIFKENNLNLLEIYVYVEYRSYNVALLFVQYKVEKLEENGFDNH